MDFVTLEPEGSMSIFWQNGVDTAVKDFVVKGIIPQPEKYYLTKRPKS